MNILQSKRKRMHQVGVITKLHKTLENVGRARDCLFTFDASKDASHTADTNVVQNKLTARLASTTNR